MLFFCEKRTSGPKTSLSKMKHFLTARAVPLEIDLTRRRRLRNCCFTLNNPDTHDGPAIMQGIISQPRLQFLVYQYEVGDNGTPHYQGYMEFTTKVAFKDLRENWFMLCGAHLAPRRGSQEQAIHYCVKPEDGCTCVHCEKARQMPHNGRFSDDPEESGPWFVGVRKRQGLRSDLKAFIEDLTNFEISRWTVFKRHRQIYARYRHFELTVYRFYSYEQKMKMFEEGRKPIVECYYGETGTGKTRSVFSRFGARNIHKPVIDGGPVVWFDLWYGQTCLLIDDFRNQIRFKAMLRLLDWYPEPQQVKGGVIMPYYTHIIITAQEHPQFWYPKMRAERRVCKADWDAFMRRFDLIERVGPPRQVVIEPTVRRGDG
jgi:hypothetical protein